MYGGWQIAAAFFALALSSCTLVGSKTADKAEGVSEEVRVSSAPSTPPQPPVLPSLNGDEAGSGSPAAGRAIVRENGTGNSIGRNPAVASKVEAGGNMTLNYVDADIREIVRAILGDLLHLNYTIDPRVQGTVSIQTPRPLARDELLSTLQGLLEQTNNTMVFENGIFRITTANNAAVVPSIVASAGGATEASQVIALHYASAKQLAQMLKPYIGDAARMLADPERNVIIITGSPTARQNLIDLIRVFDVDYLAGQSYALFPVKSGEPEQVADDLSHALGLDADGALAGAIRVVPIDQANAIMVISQQPAYLDKAARLIAQFDVVADQAGRSFQVYYLHNAQASDLQPILQTAFNPPRRAGEAGGAGAGSLPPTAVPAQVSTPSAATSSQAAQSSSAVQQSTASGGSATSSSGPAMHATNFGSQTIADQTSQVAAEPGAPQIIADPKGNSLIVVATAAEYAKVEGAIKKLDVLPAQVMIEATVAEVTLNKALQYGTQFFFNTREATTTLTNAFSPTPTGINPSSPLTSAQLFSPVLAPAFPGLAVTRLAGSTQYAIEALQSVTNVKVISAPKILILDKQSASIQVGSLVPVITQSATSVTVSGAPVVNSVDYHPTGIILNVTPRIASGGLVNLDVEQEVSDVVPTTSSNIDSPTFDERRIKSRVVVQDGETIALGGLISDKNSAANSGIPFLRDIPLLGALFSTQNNTGVRTELLVMITPHVVRNQTDARGLTEELKRKLAPPASLLDERPPSQ
jgi:general secretion pathway protein D